MSSSNLGGDNGTREDQLDLGQEDDEAVTLTNGHGGGDTTVDPDEAERSEDRLGLDDASLSVSASHDEIELKTSSPGGSSPHLPAAAGSGEDTSSLPDDTPSLHVR
jgi:hypothetical protein